jgi:hypothetical protein
MSKMRGREPIRFRIMDRTLSINDQDEDRRKKWNRTREKIKNSRSEADLRNTTTPPSSIGQIPKPDPSIYARLVNAEARRVENENCGLVEDVPVLDPQTIARLNSTPRTCYRNLPVGERTPFRLPNGDTITPIDGVPLEVDLSGEAPGTPHNELCIIPDPVTGEVRHQIPKSLLTESERAVLFNRIPSFNGLNL